MLERKKEKNTLLKYKVTFMVNMNESDFLFVTLWLVFCPDVTSVVDWVSDVSTIDQSFLSPPNPPPPYIESWGQLKGKQQG